jgi:hypothetical protein
MLHPVSPPRVDDRSKKMVFLFLYLMSVFRPLRLHYNYWNTWTVITAEIGSPWQEADVTYLQIRPDTWQESWTSTLRTAGALAVIRAGCVPNTMCTLSWYASAMKCGYRKFKWVIHKRISLIYLDWHIFPLSDVRGAAWYTFLFIIWKLMEEKDGACVLIEWSLVHVTTVSVV